MNYIYSVYAAGWNDKHKLRQYACILDIEFSEPKKEFIAHGASILLYD